MGIDVYKSTCRRASYSVVEQSFFSILLLPKRITVECSWASIFFELSLSRHWTPRGRVSKLGMGWSFSDDKQTPIVGVDEDQMVHDIPESACTGPLIGRQRRCK